MYFLCEAEEEECQDRLGDRNLMIRLILTLSQTGREQDSLTNKERKMEKEPPEIDPIEIELNLLKELVGENIVVIIHKNGMTVMMDEDLENRTHSQMSLFSRMYVASQPSFVLRAVLIMEIFFLTMMEELEDFFKRLLKKD